MKIGVIVQARLSSSRLPGKVLLRVEGKPLLGHLLDGLARAREPELLAVATSDGPQDDAVADCCAGLGIPCRRGSLHDVAGRLLQAAQDLGLDAFARICADSPLLDPGLVDQAIRLFRQGRADLVTNVFPRSYPRGQSVEVISTAALAAALPGFADPADREHVTRRFYSCPGLLRVRNFSSGGDYSGHSHCVDTPEDLLRLAPLLRRLAAGAARPGWRELLGLAEERA